MKRKTVLLAVSAILAIGIILMANISSVHAEDIKYLSDMTGTPDENCLLYLNDQTESGGKINVGGVEYEKGVVLHPGWNGPATITYNIEGLGYTNFRAIVGKDKSAGSTEAITGTCINVKVYVDGKLSLSSGNLAYPSTFNIDVDITDAKELKIFVGDGGDSITWDTTAWAEARLVKLSVTDIEMGNMPRLAYKVNEELDLNGATVKVKYSDDTFEFRSLTESMLSGYDLSKEGNQTVTVNVRGKTCEFEIYVCNDAEYVTESMISSYYGYTANVGINTNSDGGELNIAGKAYARGFGVHPAADGSGTVIDLNVSECGYNWMTITCGKDFSCTSSLGVENMLSMCAVSFDILADGYKVATTGSVFYGTCFHFIVNIKDVKTLQLKVNDEDGIVCDASDWVNVMMFNMPDEPESEEPTENPETEIPQTSDSGYLVVLASLFIAVTASVIFKKRSVV